MRISCLLHRTAVLILMLLPAASMVAQDPEIDEFSSGRQYVIAFPDTSTNAQLPLYQDSRFGDRFVIQIYSAVANSIMLTSGDAKISRRLTIAAGGFLSIDLGDPAYSALTAPVVSVVGAASRNTFRIDADKPVLVNCFTMTRAGAEAWSPPPVETWGTSYFAAMVNGDIIYDLDLVSNKLVKKPRPAESKILVIAAYDSTIVTLYPTGRTLPAFPFTVRLDAGQAYQFQSFVDTAIITPSQQVDLGGSYIRATRPVGVVTGNSRAPVADDLAGQLRNSYKNMYFEALAPVDQHGREFVYMPTWDQRRTQAKRAAEYVRVYGTTPGTTAGQRRRTNGTIDSFTVAEGAFRQLDFDRVSPAARITTTRPAQAMMHSSAVVQTVGTSFDSWSSSMTELVPREQWTSFAPFSIPIDIPGMEHFVNVVTSVASMGSIYRQDGEPFPFNQGLIPGTDLVWGTVQIPAGTTFWIEGRDDARFSAVSYGLAKGNEQSGTVRGTPYYRETVALSYSHAIAPRRRVLSSGDSLRIDRSQSCSGLAITLRSLSATPAGFRSITLDSAVNARIVSISPVVWVNATTVNIVVVPIDPSRDARGVVRIMDRSGRTWLALFERFAEKILFTPTPRLDLGELMVGESRRGDITITNPAAIGEQIRNIRLTGGDAGFTIVSTPPALPAALAAGESIRVTIEGRPVSSPLRSTDTFRIELECTTWSIPVVMESVEPCIEVGDLRFDTIPARQTRSLPLRICNAGKGRLTFTALSADSIITWEDRSFSVGSAWQNMLRAASLGAGECITIDVLFQSGQPGAYRTVARIGSSAPRCSDSSVWTAVVGGTTGIGQESAEGGLRLIATTTEAGAPIVRFGHDRREAVVVEIFDLAGRQRLAYDAGVLDAGERSLRLAVELPAGLYLVRLSGMAGSVSGWYSVAP